MSVQQEILVQFETVQASLDAAKALSKEGIADSAIVRIDSSSLGKGRGAANWTKLLGTSLAAPQAAQFATLLAAGGAILLVRARDAEQAELAEDILDEFRGDLEDDDSDDDQDEDESEDGDEDENDDDDEEDDDAEDDDAEDEGDEEDEDDTDADADETKAAVTSEPMSALADEPGDEVLRLAAEELEVAKRQVESGKTRVRRFVVEHPAEAEVSLRTETAEVHRRQAAESAVGDTEWDWADTVIEVIEMREEAVVSKITRVAEEIVIRKGMTERVETIRDTVRRQQIAIERLDDSGNLIVETH